MLVRYVDKWHIERALDNANAYFDDNLRFKRFEHSHNVVGKGGCWHVTITVKDSSGPGSRVSVHGRRISAACWHAYGVFMSSLPRVNPSTGARVQIVSSPGFVGAGRRVVSPGDQWLDWQAGSIFYPAYMSELCDCGYSTGSQLQSALSRESVGVFVANNQEI